MTIIINYVKKSVYFYKKEEIGATMLCSCVVCVNFTLEN